MVDENGEEAPYDEDGLHEEKRQTLSEDGYKKELWVHYHLPLDANPSKAKLEKIYEMIHSDDADRVERGKTLMLGCMSSYILATIKKSYSTYMPLHLSEMMQQGYEAVTKGMDGFDPGRGTLTTYYSTRIVHGIQEYINELHGSTPHYTSALKKIREFVKRRTEKGLDFTIQDVCIETGLSMTTVLQCVRIKDTRKVSLDTTEIIGYLQSACKTPEEIAIENEEKAYVLRLLNESNLTPKERICVCMRHGIGMEDGEGRSYAEIADEAAEFGFYMIPSEVQRIIAEAIKKMQQEHGRLKRATLCRRIRTDIDNRISGDMISKMSMMSDQEAVSEYFKSGVYNVDRNIEE